MKLHWILIFIMLLIGCQENQLKENPPSIKHTDNIKKEYQSIESFKVVKEYEINFKINILSDTVQFFRTTEEIYFGFYQLNGNKYFFPKSLLISARSSNYSFNNFRKLTIEKHSKNELEFELDLCVRMITKKSKGEDKVGFITTSKVKKEIKKIIENDSINTISILSENYSNNIEKENTICSKFHFKKVGSKVFANKKEFINKIIPKDLIKYGELEIIETGNILDTLEIGQKIWDGIGEDF